MSKSYDYVIVGAGPAGCILAARLTEDPENSVLLIEAGGDKSSLFRTMPLGLPFVYQDARVQWGHYSGPEPELAGRKIEEKADKLIGGSSSINAMIYNRGNPMDYEGWASEAGLTEWDWAHVLPYFKKLETFSDRDGNGESEFRGGDGPMKIHRAQAKHKLFDAFIEAGDQAGFDIPIDHNGYQQEGMHIAQVNIHKGERWSAARAYLEPALRRKNLTVMTHATVNRIIVTGGEASGVEVQHRGLTRTIDVDREVILAAGAMNSPKLLMLSGIGPVDELKRHGISVVAEAPQVGKNAQNHPGVDVQFSTRNRDSLTSEIGLLKQPFFGTQWMLTRKGIGGSNLFEAGAFLRTREDVDFPNMQYEFLPLSRKVVRGKVVAMPGFQVWMDLSRPESRGEVTLTSADPSAPVKTVFNTYSVRQDLQDVIDGVRLLRERIATQPALQRFKPKELNPGPDITDDRAVEAWVRQHTGTSYHASSTCSMGTDNDNSVVDGQGRVHAVKGLRVVDASIMPLSVTGNLHSGIIMLAEKIADYMRGVQLVPSEAGFYFKPGKH
ncbi:choline dehydrogenase [Leucobacter sp. GX24907]